MSTVYINLVGSKLLLSFERNPHIEGNLRKISGARFNREYGRWECQLSSYNRLLDALDDVKISQAVMEKFQAEADLKRKVEELRKADYVELENYTPKLPMMPHQKKAFLLHQLLPGSANLSQMGVGKSFSAIAIAHWRIEMGHTPYVLVVCPKSVMRGWEEQLEIFSDLTYVSISGAKKEDRLEKLNLKRDVYLINYEYTWRITEELLAKKFNLIIADEAHRIKNPDSNQSKACYTLADAAEYKIALTGTPILNSPLDAFGLMRLISPDVFGESFYSFRSKYFINVGGENSPIQIYVPKHGANEEISDKLYTKSLRFLKEDVLKDLPPQIPMPDRLVNLSPEQDQAYRKLQEDLCAEIGDGKTIKISHILTLMLKLNQITSGWIKDPDTGEIIHFKQNPKLEELKEVVEDAGDQPILIWAYYKADMELITNYFGRCTKCKSPVNRIKAENCSKCNTYIKYRCSEIQGSTKNRNAEMAKFKFTPEERAEQRVKFTAEGKSKVEINSELDSILDDGSEPPQTNIFVLQSSAGSEGTNLQRSTMSIFFSRNWSLKDALQALARNHRQGQTKPVTYVNLVARMMNGDETVDQRIVNALKKKEDISKLINKDDLTLLTGKKMNLDVHQDIEETQPQQVNEDLNTSNDIQQDKLFEE